ncbi:hypothetical protein GCM10027073_69060 [Streptomyces chlorus]
MQGGRRYPYVYGLTPEAFGQVAVVVRKYAATNPAAYFHGRPISLADRAASRWIVEPLRLLDCCQEKGSGQVLATTAAGRARGLAPSGCRGGGGRAGSGAVTGAAGG